MRDGAAEAKRAHTAVVYIACSEGLLWKLEDRCSHLKALDNEWIEHSQLWIAHRNRVVKLLTHLQ